MTKKRRLLKALFLIRGLTELNILFKNLLRCYPSLASHVGSFGPRHRLNRGFFCVLGGDAAFPRAGAFKMIAELLNILEELKRKTGTK